VNELSIHPLGDQALSIVLENEISPEVSQKVLSLAQAIEKELAREIIETVPAYSSLSVYFHPLTTSFESLSTSVQKLWEELQIETDDISQEVVEIPVLYGGEIGPDLDRVAKQSGLTPEEVINHHTSREYRVYMIGFLPGFPYLGGLDEQLATPRLDTPRQNVKAGSVGIADRQTGMYPIDSPGGWNIIGQTPVKLFDPQREDPFLLKAGQSLRFKQVSEEEWKTIRENKETYELKVRRGG